MRKILIIVAFMILSALPTLAQIDLHSHAITKGYPSVKVEPGVLTLFSMQTKEDPCKIYILEIYADQEAYQSHIQTAHFKKYKEGTAKMVKSLKLIDVNPLAGMVR